MLAQTVLNTINKKHACKNQYSDWFLPNIIVPFEYKVAGGTNLNLSCYEKWDLKLINQSLAPPLLRTVYIWSYYKHVIWALVDNYSSKINMFCCIFIC